MNTPANRSGDKACRDLANTPWRPGRSAALPAPVGGNLDPCSATRREPALFTPMREVASTSRTLDRVADQLLIRHPVPALRLAQRHPTILVLLTCASEAALQDRFSPRRAAVALSVSAPRVKYSICGSAGGLQGLRSLWQLLRDCAKALASPGNRAFEAARGVTIAVVSPCQRKRRQPGLATDGPELVVLPQLVGGVERSQVHFDFVGAARKNRRAAAGREKSPGLTACFAIDRHRVPREHCGGVEEGPMMLATVETVTKADPVWQPRRRNSYVAAQAAAGESVHAAPPQRSSDRNVYNEQGREHCQSFARIALVDRWQGPVEPRLPKRRSTPCTLRAIGHSGALGSHLLLVSLPEPGPNRAGTPATTAL